MAMMAMVAMAACPGGKVWRVENCDVKSCLSLRLRETKKTKKTWQPKARRKVG